MRGRCPNRAQTPLVRRLGTHVTEHEPVTFWLMRREVTFRQVFRLAYYYLLACRGMYLALCASAEGPG